MAEKILNTRISLKIDTLENWNKSTLPLRKGELALATVAATAGTSLTEPVVMMKVGEDGVKTFKDLEWNMYAKASDVVSAAKSETSLKTFIEGVIDSADMASNEDFTELVEKVETLNGDDTTAGSVAKSIKDAIDALNLSDTYAAKEHEHTVADITDFDTSVKAYNYVTKKELNDGLDTKQDVIPENTYDAYGAAAQALADAKKYADDNDADTQYGIEYDSANKKIKLVSDTSKTEIDATAFIKDGMIETVELSDDGLDIVITWNTDAGKSETTIPLSGLVDVYTGVDGTTVKVTVSSDNKIGAEVKTGTIKDGHIASDAAIAKSKLASDVQASLGKADTALQASDIADLNVKSHEHNNFDLLETYTQTEANLADAVAKKHAHTFVESELNKIADGDVEKWNAKVDDVTASATSGLKATRTGNNIAVEIDESVTFIFDCGDSEE